MMAYEEQDQVTIDGKEIRKKNPDKWTLHMVMVWVVKLFLLKI